MPTKHLYVEESVEATALWEQAAAVAIRERRSVSWIVHEALRMYLRAVAIEQDKQARRAQA